MPNTEKETGSDPSTVATHTKQTPENKPTKEKKDLYHFERPKNIKTLETGIQEDDRRRRNIHARVNRMKTPSLAKQSTDRTAAQARSKVVLDRQQKLCLNLSGGIQDKDNQCNLNKTNAAGGMTALAFKLYH